MNLLAAVPLAAFVAGLAALGAEALELRGRRVPARLALHVATGVLATATFALLLIACIAGRFEYETVFLYTSSDLALRYRFASSWAGREGSMALWTAWLAVVGAAVALRHAWRLRHRDAGERSGQAAASDIERAQGWTRLGMAALLALFLFATWRQGTFDRTPSFFLEGRPSGAGLNPTLQSPFMLIHPPMMFLAYALTAVPAAAAFGHWVSGTNLWSRVASTWSRINWLLYTFAMGLGGMWAYYTLGFGGYWAWDPVEVANLLPWLALTLYLHAQLHHRRFGDYAVVGPFLAVLPLLLTLFSTVSTRSGLWVSVHAFTDPTGTFDPDAPGRFLAILAVEPGLGFHVAVFLAIFLGALAAWCVSLARSTGRLRRFATSFAALLAGLSAYALLAPRPALSLLFEVARVATAGRTGWGLGILAFAACILAALPSLASPAPPTRLKLDLRGLGYLSVLSLGAGLLVLFLFHNAAANGWSTEFYEVRLPWLATPALLGIVLLQVSTAYTRRRGLQAAGLALLAALAVALAAGRGSLHGGAYLLTLAVAVVASGLDRFRTAGVPAHTSPRQRRAGLLLLAAALLDALFWLNPPSRVGLPGLWLGVGWPAQLLLGGLALLLVAAAHRVLADAPRRFGLACLAAGLLGGFYVAAPLAAAAWWTGRKHAQDRPVDRAAKARLRLAALHGVHLAVTVALAGYAVSTYWHREAHVDLSPGLAVDAVGTTLNWTGTDADRDGATPFAKEVRLRIEGENGVLEAPLRWEPTPGGHLPRPDTLRSWHGDLYVDVESVHAAATPCGAEHQVDAFQPSGRLCEEPGLDAARVTVAVLPGLGVVWLALLLFVLYMGMAIVWRED